MKKLTSITLTTLSLFLAGCQTQSSSSANSYGEGSSILRSSSQSITYFYNSPKESQDSKNQVNAKGGRYTGFKAYDLKPHILKFNYTHLPNLGMSEQEVIAQIDEASEIWFRGCSIRFSRVATRTSGEDQGRAIWQEVADVAGTGTLGNSYSRPKDFTITLSPSSFQNQYQQASLTWVIAHEMGHVIGLRHNNNPQSVMNVNTERVGFINLSDWDASECKRIRQRWIE